jgi:3-dehydroquinate synthase
LRAILNFGHTIGHALEAISHYGRYLHGEAISIGQVAAARLSARAGGLAQSEVRRITDLFRRAGLPIELKLSTSQLGQLQQAMRLDKKVSRGEVRFVLARKIGQVESGRKVSPALLKETLNHQSATTD